MTTDIRVATSQADIAACMAVRWVVFVHEQNVPPELELDGSDEGAVHVLARDDGRVVGAARYHLTGDVVKIARVCVPAADRGRGIGADLIRFILQQTPGKAARLSAQTDALDFYRKLGFRAFGPVYDDAGIPHQDMERPTP